MTYRLRLEIDAPDKVAIATVTRRIAQLIEHGAEDGVGEMGSENFPITYEYDVIEVEGS